MLTFSPKRNTSTPMKLRKSIADKLEIFYKEIENKKEKAKKNVVTERP